MIEVVHPLSQIGAWGLALAWVLQFVDAYRGLPTVPNLNLPEDDRSPPAHPALTVIVPARNEAPNVGACLQSLLTQDYPNLQIIAIDDRSTDETGTIMDSLAAAYPERLTVLHIEALPANWLGKTHAMAIAAQQAVAAHRPDYLLFTDADILFTPEILRRSLAQAEAVAADHFVTLPTTIIKTRGEAMLLSYLQVMGLFAVRPWRVAKPGRRDAIGVGAFNLIRTSAYQQLGGFEATPMEVLEDLTLGRRVKLAGLRQRVAIAPGAVTVHWAPGANGILNGMTKNLFAIFRFRPMFLLVAAAWLAFFCIGPVGFLFLRATRIPALITLAAVFGLYSLSSRASRISPWNAVLFPVSAALVVYSMLRSMAVTLKDGGVTWRGTFYPLAGLRKEAKATTDRS